MSDRLQGVLRSRTFTIEHRYIHYLAAGRGGRINVVVDGFEKIRDPIYGGLTTGGQRRRRAALDHPGRRDVAGPSRLHRDRRRRRRSTSTERRPTSDRRPRLHRGRRDPHVRPAASRRAPAAPRLAPIDLEAADRGACAPTSPLLAGTAASRPGRVPLGRGEIPDPTLALAIADGTGENERVLIRGNHQNPGEVVPRRFLEVLGGPDQATRRRRAAAGSSWPGGWSIPGPIRSCPG